MSAVYIKSAACISVQDTLNDNFFETLKPENSVQILKAIEPNYKEFIPPAMSRRMSKTVKMSSVASTKALQEAGIEKPDAIIVGTGMGCSQDSEKFLKNVIRGYSNWEKCFRIFRTLIKKLMAQDFVFNSECFRNILNKPLREQSECLPGVVW